MMRGLVTIGNIWADMGVVNLNPHVPLPAYLIRQHDRVLYVTVHITPQVITFVAESFS